MIVIFEVLRKTAGVNITDEALFKISELVTVVMCVNVLLSFAEVLTEWRSWTHHTIHTQYYFQGVNGHIGLGKWAWTGVSFNLIALTLLLIPKTRKNFNTLNLACGLLFVGVFIEKGIGLILPGLTPGLLGEVYEYMPSRVELMIGVGVAAAGALVFTLITKVAIPLALSHMTEEAEEPGMAARRAPVPIHARRSSSLLWLGLILPALWLAPWGGPATAQTRDWCVECHRNPRFLVTNKKLYEYFQQWEGSVHEQDGVGCEDCHGGDPRKPDKDAAHAGDLSESATASAVNFKNIPRTCGLCHQNVYHAYQSSNHYEHLVANAQEEQGPSCVTCHGSINADVLNVATVQESCARCHNAELENHPENPDRARIILNKFLSIHRFYRYITVRDPGGSREFFQTVDDAIDDLSVTWHTFDLDRIEKKTRIVLELLKAKRDELRARGSEG
jgi:nitrate/TMAO reductase-like tetraheme cytochrome c subunit